MTTSTSIFENSPIARAGDFLRLGLRRGECSANTIRNAVQESVQRLASGSYSDKSMFDRQLGLIATSAYRILDPRYRVQLYERVQLTYALDREERDSEVTKTEDLWNVPKSAIPTPAFEVFVPAVDEQGDEEASLNQAREIVRAVRQSEIVEKRHPKGVVFRWRLRLQTWLNLRAR